MLNGDCAVAAACRHPWGPLRYLSRKNGRVETIRFTICLCVGPNLDGYRAPKMKHWPCKTHNRSRNPNTKPVPYRLVQVKATLTLPTSSMHYTTALLSGEACFTMHVSQRGPLR